MLPGDLLQWLGLGQKTGTLVVANGGVEKKIFLRRGRVISSASNDPREYLGQFLMSHGYITEEELAKAMDVQRQSGVLLGKILATIDVISEEDLTRLMRMKAEEAIYDIFLWTEGEFRFIDNEIPTMEMIPLHVDVTGIIMEGTRRADEWVRIREVIPNETFVPVVVKQVDLSDEEDFGEAQKLVFHAIDGKRTITELVLESRSSAFVVSSTLYTLISNGAVRLIDPSAAKLALMRQEAMAPPLTVPNAVPIPMSDDDEIESMLSRAQSALKVKDYEKMQRLLRAAQNLDPNNARIKSAIKGAEAVILNDLHQQGLVESKVPRIAKPFEEITQMNFTPNEGFILSRINGQWDIGSLIKISPIRESDAMLIFFKLWRDGVITLA